MCYYNNKHCCYIYSLSRLLALSLCTDSVFGATLHELVQTEGSLVPRFILYFIEHIEQNGLDVVGLYRVSGNAALVQKLRFLVEKSEQSEKYRLGYFSHH